MKLQKSTYSKIQKLSRDRRFNYFFNNMKQQQDDDVDVLLDKLADMMVVELNIEWDDIDKIKFFLKLAYCAHD